MPVGGREDPPFMPGRALSFGSVLVLGATLVCNDPGAPFLSDGVPAVPGLAVELMRVCFGGGSSPFWIARVFFDTVSGV